MKAQAAGATLVGGRGALLDRWLGYLPGFGRNGRVSRDEAAAPQLDAVAERSRAFYAQCSEILATAPQPRDPKGVVLFCNMGSIKFIALTLLVMHRLRREGWATIDMTPSEVSLGETGNPVVDRFAGILTPNGEKRGFSLRRRGVDDPLHFDWTIDWPNQVCEAEGINFYGIVAGRLGKEYRRATVEIDGPKPQARLDALVRSVDAALMACKLAQMDLSENGIPVRITGFEPNYPPTGVFKVFCALHGEQLGMEFVEIVQAYEHYFKAGNFGTVGALAVENLTRNRGICPLLVSPTEFQSWSTRQHDIARIVEDARSAASQNRTGRAAPPPEAERILEQVTVHRAAGGKVGCLFGAVPYDIGHPWIDEGFAHRDLADWLNHSIESVRGSDTLLLIKPHPSELDVEIIGRPSQFFTEMIEGAPPENVVVLEHRWLNVAELVPHLDFGMTWRGSVAIELAVLGIPALVCTKHVQGDGILDFPEIADRDHFARMLRQPELIPFDPAMTERAAMLLACMQDGSTMIPYTFGRIGTKTRLSGPPVWDMDAVNSYLRNGHLSIDRIAGKFQ